MRLPSGRLASPVRASWWGLETDVLHARTEGMSASPTYGSFAFYFNYDNLELGVSHSNLLEPFDRCLVASNAGEGSKRSPRAGPRGDARFPREAARLMYNSTIYIGFRV